MQEKDAQHRYLAGQRGEPNFGQLDQSPISWNAGRHSSDEMQRTAC